MFLTTELLNKYHAPCEVVEKFRDKYPNGIDTILFLDNCQKKIEDVDFRKVLFWGYMALPLGKNEKEKYREILEIDTSEKVFDSWKVFDSKTVAKSQKITESKFVYDSSNIFDCENIFSSDNANGSYYLFYSSDVVYSNRIAQSHRINACASVLSSQIIEDAREVAACTRVTGARSVCSCMNCHDIYYSNYLVDCHHCLFCNDLKDKSFMIFNTQFTEREFFTIVELVKDHEFTLEPMVRTEPLKNSFEGFRAITVPNIFSHYNKMTQKDFDFLYSLPHYNAWVVYQITMNNKAFRDLKNS